ncbi:AAA family ATPase [Streptococcus sp. S784/96/1]|uniref:AAA family ATPase n=1 Tax=Streptococcus sp. S784/96/1 TaxID=2653499 RepID=UPI0013899878|nr:AAA family ATPase [Streptococcus sp. S784/96/1]
MIPHYLHGLVINWDQVEAESYLPKIPALASVSELSFSTSVTFFVGENGSGKSTLLEAIAVADGFNAEGGSRNYRFSTYDSHSELHEAVRLKRGIKKSSWGYFLRAESFYNVATMEEEYFGARSKHYHKQSHGESFLSLLENQSSDNGFYLLDEPEAALSPQRQLTLLYHLHEQVKRGSQFIIATHSPILLGFPEARILSFDDGQVQEVAYEECSAYQITKLFLEDRERVLHNLLKAP